MADYNWLDATGLGQLWGKIKEKFVAKEHKTGSDSEYKVLSDNNLTDDLLKKINNAGDSSFTGSYDDLTNKPSIDGHTIAAGDQTAASLGLATTASVTTATQDMATQTWVSGQGYQNASQVSSSISSATSGMATQTWVGEQGFATTENVNTLINNAVTTAFVYKGTKTSVSELPPSGNKVGDIWHVTEDNNEYAWDGANWEALGGNVDLSGYIKTTDVEAIDEDTINSICV